MQESKVGGYIAGLKARQVVRLVYVLVCKARNGRIVYYVIFLGLILNV